ncbi:hypothetical protein T07_11190 [Trichinella nelsoni]|uniref:Uncharacterized protein n=1 Tax=Trichinella nelsoni TaxID=6336 RepID=A0A0V0RWA0_9BILA|nr:hypothetical protein T07_11190 [Trichinella nelsoni]
MCKTSSIMYRFEYSIEQEEEEEERMIFSIRISNVRLFLLAGKIGACLLVLKCIEYNFCQWFFISVYTIVLVYTRRVGRLVDCVQLVDKNDCSRC